MIRVLFVCLGNICRSPMAEAVFMHHVHAAGLASQIIADSAGTGHWHLGEPPHPGTMRILHARGIPYAHRARLITRHDLEHFDYILTMDEMNWQDVQELGPGRAKVMRLMEFAPHTGQTEVPDPYYSGRFEEVYHLVNEATQGLLEYIRREHGV
ncbi:MAG: low molecular weight protein-tyrosine-phosphatase [Chloroherpetonaceae bacterium]|nr:low molecular weight phosphotyrosine protein phosphatase [Chthonomonadaceae bacterium]MDW8209230.1 low molecular weight protein-tyrosine-phosphatase [Chloroherpetonaceae bacterium]